MNDNFFYDIDEILRALDHYQGDPFFSQQYAALLQEQISKGLDLLLKKDIPSKSMLFRYLILLYIKKQYRTGHQKTGSVCCVFRAKPGG